MKKIVIDRPDKEPLEFQGKLIAQSGYENGELEGEYGIKVFKTLDDDFVAAISGTDLNGEEQNIRTMTGSLEDVREELQEPDLLEDGDYAEIANEVLHILFPNEYD